MSKMLKKGCALALATAMTAGLLAGCGSDKGNAEKNTVTEGKDYKGLDISQHVDLKMYLLGAPTDDFDEVYAEVNKILEDKLNCSLSVDFLSWGEHDTKYSLLFSSQEDFDLIFTASPWAHYEQTVALGGFYPMSEEFVHKNAPDVWDVVPEIAWDQAKISGTAYMVPNNRMEFGQDVYAVRGDLMEKYGIESISSWDDLYNFAMACAKDGIFVGNGAPWYQYFQDKGMSLLNGIPNELVLYNTQDPEDLDYKYILDWDEFKEYCNEAKEMAAAGCWSRDVLNSTEERQVPFLSGRSAGLFWNTGACRNFAREGNKSNPDWKATIQDPCKSQPKKVNPYTNNGIAINNGSKNPERAMMVINELYTNQELQDLTCLGIEGKHWEAVGDKEFKIIDESGYGVDSNCNWGWKNDEIGRTEFVENKTEVDETYAAMVEDFEQNAKEVHPYDGFSFDATNVTTQVAAVQGVVDTYQAPLINGLVDDVDTAIEELRSSLDSAGMQDILDELDRQLKEYIASKSE